MKTLAWLKTFGRHTPQEHIKGQCQIRESNFFRASLELFNHPKIF